MFTNKTDSFGEDETVVFTVLLTRLRVCEKEVYCLPGNSCTCNEWDLLDSVCPCLARKNLLCIWFQYSGNCALDASRYRTLGKMNCVWSRSRSFLLQMTCTCHHLFMSYIFLRKKVPDSLSQHSWPAQDQIRYILKVISDSEMICSLLTAHRLTPTGKRQHFEFVLLHFIVV